MEEVRLAYVNQKSWELTQIWKNIIEWLQTLDATLKGNWSGELSLRYIYFLYIFYILLKTNLYERYIMR